MGDTYRPGLKLAIENRLEILEVSICFFVRVPSDFPHGPVVKTLCCQCRGHRFNPWSGKFLMLYWVAKKKKERDYDMYKHTHTQTCAHLFIVVMVVLVMAFNTTFAISLDFSPCK